MALGVAWVLVAGVAGVTTLAAAPQGAMSNSNGALFVNRPEGSVASAVAWVEAVLAHAPGRRDDAVQLVGAWQNAVVTGLRVETASIRLLMREPRVKVFPLPIEFDRGRPREIRYTRSERDALEEAAVHIRRTGLSHPDFVARAVVLHTDIALLGEGTGNVLRYADGTQVDLELRIADHWAAARAFGDGLDARAGRNADLALWYRATLAVMALAQMWNAAHADRAVERFGDEAEVQFLAGCLHETLAGGRTQAALDAARIPATMVVRVGSRGAELDRAAALLRRAVALQPNHGEARLRYGRVLTLTGRAEQAVGELRRALGLVTEPAQKYFAQLFLGAALEAAGRRPAARAAYQAAAVLIPAAQAPRLALSQLAFSSGDRAEASAAIAPLLALPADESRRQDPWWSYSASCGRNAGTLIEQAQQRLWTPQGERQ